MEKSPKEIKRQIEFWFLKYFGKEKEEFDGSELFTLFDLIDETFKNSLSLEMGLNKSELPVLALKVSDNEIIINTTERFIRLSNSVAEYLEYKDFEYHNGYESFLATRLPSGKPISVKTDGYTSNFSLRKRDGEIVKWEIPTGSPGYGFWNVTKKCELIGRKYLK